MTTYRIELTADQLVSLYNGFAESLTRDEFWDNLRPRFHEPTKEVLTKIEQLLTRLDKDIASRN